MKSFGFGVAYHIGRASRELIGGELLGTVPMPSCVPQGSLIGPPPSFLYILNYLQDALELLTLLFADDVK